MKVHLLDTSALSRLVEEDAGLARHRLLEEVGAERIVVLATDPLMWELMGARAASEQKYYAMMDFLVRVTRTKVLVARAQRLRREVRFGRALTLAEFIDEEHYVTPLVDPDVVDRSAAHGRAVEVLLREDEMRKATETVRQLDELEARMRAHALGEARGLRFAAAEMAAAGSQPRDEDLEAGPRPTWLTGFVFNDSWRDGLKRAHRAASYAMNYAEGVARHAMEDLAAHEGVDASLVDPRTLPTFWSSALIHTARIRAVLLAGHSPTGNKSMSQIDRLHLVEAASYGDVFVSRDRALRAFARDVQGLWCQVMSFEEWADRLVR